MLQRLFAILFFCASLSVYGQYDKEFWFAAPVVTPSNTPGGGQPVYLHFNTNIAPATITIDMPANPAFGVIILNVEANSNNRLALTYAQIANVYSTYEGVNGKNNLGIRIKSTALINVLYEYGNPSNADVFSLKGTNALGTEFYTSFQNATYNQNLDWATQAYSAFDIVATEDNTIVTIEMPNDSRDIFGYAGLNTFTVNLDRGETFTGIPDKVTVPNNGWKATDVYGRASQDHLHGIRITTNGKKIAVNLKDDSMVSLISTASDLAIDQTIPLSKAGNEYVAIRGFMLQTPINPERVYITGTQNNDTIWLNDTLVSAIQKQQTVAVTLKALYNHIRTKYTSYALQVTGFGDEAAEAILPPINKCTGTTEVTFSRPSSNNFYLEIIVRKGSENDFFVNGKPSSMILGNSFLAIPGEDSLLAARLGPFTTAQIPVNTAITISNYSNVFHLAILNGILGYTARFAYLSDYNQPTLEVFNTINGTKSINACFGDSIQLVSKGGLNYSWIPNTYLDNNYSHSPIAFARVTTRYKVSVEGACGKKASDTVRIRVSTPINADFVATPSSGCAPLRVDFSSLVKATKKLSWNLGDTSFIWNYADTLSYDSTFSRTFKHTGTLAKNNPIQLIVYNQDNCTDTLNASILINPDIHAAFTQTDTAGCDPFIVQFTNQSTGNTDATRYSWEFGDNGSSNDVNPIHTFINETEDDTSYIAKLISTSPYFCSDTITKTFLVSPYMYTNFTLDTTAACVNLDIEIRNQCQGVDSLFLDFGDGSDTTMLTFNNIQHSYSNASLIPEQYNIRMIGKNTQGCYDTIIRIINVYPAVNAAFTPNPINGCDSVLINLNNLSTGYQLSYQWTFGDGSSSIANEPIHRYLNKDTATINYQVKLIALSSNLCTDTTETIIPIYPFLRASFTIDSIDGCQPFPVVIANKSIGADSYTWSFGDGITSTSSADTINHNFTNSSFTTDSTYRIKLTISNTQGCIDSSSRNITAFHTITAGIYPDTSNLCSPSLFHFTSTSQGATTYFWNFGDGATSILADSTKHLYEEHFGATPDTIQVRLFVTAANSICYAMADTFIVVNPSSIATFALYDHIDCTPFNALFDNSSIGASNTYKWFIDGIQNMTAPSDTSNFTLLFTNPSDTIQSHIIRIESVNNETCASAHQDTVSVYPFVKANFNTLTGLGGCHPFTARFVDSSIYAQNYKWDFGDTSYSVLSNPTKVFRNFNNAHDTTYTVQLIVNTDNCIDTISRIITVYANPDANYETDRSVSCPPVAVTISNVSVATSATYYWNFGDGNYDTTSSVASVIHLYDNFDSTNDIIIYDTLSMYAITPQGCRDSARSIIQVYPRLVARFTVDTVGCSPHDVQFINQSSNSYQFIWNFNNGFTSSMENPPQRYSNLGFQDTLYYPKLTAISKYGCIDSVTDTIVVYPRPIADLSVTPVSQQFSPSSEVTLTNKTKSRTAWNYLWYFNDNTSSTTGAASFVHPYTIWGPNSDLNRLYDTLVAYNPLRPMCRDTAVHVIRIFAPLPQVSIAASITEGCEPLTIDFVLTTKYVYPDSTSWDFDDGSILIADTSETHQFTTNGIYNISAKVVGDGGINSDYINIEVFRKPIIDFKVDPTVLMLPEATVQCFNLTQFGQSYLWEFGDGETSTEESPLHSYNDSSNYDITLIVTTKNNCIDTLTKENFILVYDPGDVLYPTAFKPSVSGSTGGKYDDAYEGYEIFRPLPKNIEPADYTLQIFNRWGELLFQTTDVYTGWDGYYNEKICPMGVYVWIAQGKFVNGDNYLKRGTITLLR